MCFSSMPKFNVNFMCPYSTVSLIHNQCISHLYNLYIIIYFADIDPLKRRYSQDWGAERATFWRAQGIINKAKLTLVL